MRHYRKPWRKLKSFRKHGGTLPVRFRTVLLVVLAAEGIWLVLGNSSGDGGLWHLENRTEVYEGDLGSPGQTREWRIWGLRVRFEDGRLDIYRYEQHPVSY